MNFVQVILKYVAVIVLGILIFKIDGIENINKNFTIATIAVISVLKSGYFITFSFRKIIEVSLKNTPYHLFLIFMATNISLIIISFSIDYFCLSEIDPHSYYGINNSISFTERYFDFLYYSVLGFTNFGYDQISPRSAVAKVLIAMELLISFATIIFILSDFISLKDSLSSSVKNKKGENKKGVD